MQARRAVASENHVAKGLGAFDMQSAFAQAVGDSLEGGKAAILRPERRRELVAAAVRVGLRPFAANLIMAAVQDASRHGDRFAGAEGEEEAAGTRANPARNDVVVPAPRIEKPTVARSRVMLFIAATMALAVGLFCLLVGWISGGGDGSAPLR